MMEASRCVDISTTWTRKEGREEGEELRRSKAMGGKAGRRVFDVRACRLESPQGVEDHARTMRYLVRTERDMFYQPEEGQWLERSEVESWPGRLNFCESGEP